MRSLPIAMVLLGAVSLPAAAMDWFDYVDSNGDGEISRQEAMAGQQQHFQSIDLDGDGTINMYEWQSYMTRDFDAVDSNADDMLSRDEWEDFRQGWEDSQG